MSKKQSTAAIEEAPGLGDIESLFPPTSASDSVRLAANVSMKLPVFWPDAAEVWFAQADAQFAIRNVTVSKKKFYNSVAVLPQEVALQILDLIRTPPTEDPYGVLRERLITLYTLNDYQRFEALVSLPLSRDQKQSHLMNRMLALLPDDCKPDFILRGLFLQCLPIDVRSHLLREKVSDPRALALKADELYQSCVSSSSLNLLSEDLQVNLVSSRTPKTPDSVKSPALFGKPSSLSKSSPTQALTSRSPTPSRLCWFYKKHDEKANNCRKPCSFLGSE